MSVATVVTCKYVSRATLKSLCWVPWRHVDVSLQRHTSWCWGPTTGLQNAEFVSKADVRLRCVLRITVHHYVSCFLDHWLLEKKKWFAVACFSVSFMCHSDFYTMLSWHVPMWFCMFECMMYFPKWAWYLPGNSAMCRHLDSNVSCLIFLISGRCVLMFMLRVVIQPKCAAPMWWKTPMWGQFMQCAWDHNECSAAMCWKVIQHILRELSHFHVM